MTDADAINVAKQKCCGPIVKLEDDDWLKPHGVIIVDLATNPPTVSRIDDEFPHLR